MLRYFASSMPFIELIKSRHCAHYTLYTGVFFAYLLSMSTEKTHTIKFYEADPRAREAIAHVFKRAGCDGFCEVIEGEDPSSLVMQTQESETIFPKPVRMGEVLKMIQKSLSQAHGDCSQDAVSIAGFSLDVAGLDLISPDGKAIRLTDKEKGILLYLHQNQDRVVERTELLSHVWEYAENVETHTLETHIYRLRQKIEKDPANPAILLTKDQGYALAEF